MQNGETADTRAITRRKFLAALAMGGAAVVASLVGATPAHAGGKKPRRPLTKRRKTRAKANATTSNAQQQAKNSPAELERGTFVGWGGCNGCSQ
jgi:hypothetical protein